MLLFAPIVTWAGAVPSGIPVVHDGGDATEVVAFASTKSGLATAELTALPLDTLLAAPPQAQGDAVIRRCAKTPTQMAEVHADLARAEAAFAKRDPFGAMDHLDLAVATLGCLSQIVEPEAASRIFRLRAAVELSEEDLDGARGELRTALAFVPGLEWADGLPPAGVGVLDTERTVTATAQVSTLPPGSTSGPWLDGRSMGIAAQVTPGLHLAQYGTTAGIRSAWLVVGGDATLVVPSSVRRPVVERMTDPRERPQVEALLAAAIPDFYAAYVVHGGGLWLVTRDQDQLATTELVAPAPAVVAPPSGKRKKPKR